MKGHVRKRRTWEFIVDVGPHPVTGGDARRARAASRRRRTRRVLCTSSFVTSREEAIPAPSGSVSPRTWIGGSTTNALGVSGRSRWRLTKATFAERLCRQSAV